MAEKEGFEPPEGVNPQRFSRPPHSTALPLLRQADITGVAKGIQVTTKHNISKPFFAEPPRDSFQKGSAKLWFAHYVRARMW